MQIALVPAGLRGGGGWELDAVVHVSRRGGVLVAQDEGGLADRELDVGGACELEEGFVGDDYFEHLLRVLGEPTLADALRGEGHAAEANRLAIGDGRQVALTQGVARGPGLRLG